MWRMQSPRKRSTECRSVSLLVLATAFPVAPVPNTVAAGALLFFEARPLRERVVRLSRDYFFRAATIRSGFNNENSYQGCFGGRTISRGPSSRP